MSTYFDRVPSARPRRFVLGEEAVGPGRVGVSGSSCWIRAVYQALRASPRRPRDRDEVVTLFREWAMAPQQSRFRDMVRKRLRGKDLGCYCRLDWCCHADVLLQIANDGGETTGPPPEPPTGLTVQGEPGEPDS
jgi:hypothetical protein